MYAFCIWSSCLKLVSNQSVSEILIEIMLTKCFADTEGLEWAVSLDGRQVQALCLLVHTFFK